MSNDVRLSAPAERLLNSMCAHYKTRVSYGTEMREAFYFGGAEEIAARLSLEESVSDVSEISKELHRFGFINGLYGFDGLLECRLTQEGLNHYDQRFTRTVKPIASAAKGVAEIICGFKK